MTRPFEKLDEEKVFKDPVHHYIHVKDRLIWDLIGTGGKKFAGISQRRLRKGVAVQIYLCVTGSGSMRAELIRDFYKLSLGDAEDTAKYPDIWPNVMASLSELYGSEISMTQLMQDLCRTMGSYGAVIPSSFTDEEQERYQADYERMIERNKKAFG